MNDYWYLCGDTGVIKYAGKFLEFDDVVDHLGAMPDGDRSVWIFSELPKVETPIGGEYNLVIGDLVTVEVAGCSDQCFADAAVTGSPKGITVETKYYE